MNITIEEMKLEDLDNINLVDFDNFWNENMLKEELSLPYSYFIIAKIENDIVGFAGIQIILDEAHISNIVTRTDKRNNGIGSMLLQNLINKASKMTKSITLEVNEKNLVAIHLYEKYGFKNVGIRKKYYYNKYNAYIMTKYFN